MSGPIWKSFFWSWHDPELPSESAHSCVGGPYLVDGAVALGLCGHGVCECDDHRWRWRGSGRWSAAVCGHCGECADRQFAHSVDMVCTASVGTERPGGCAAGSAVCDAPACNRAVAVGQHCAGCESCGRCLRRRFAVGSVGVCSSDGFFGRAVSMARAMEFGDFCAGAVFGETHPIHFGRGFAITPTLGQRGHCGLPGADGVRSARLHPPPGKQAGRVPPALPAVQWQGG